MFNFFLLFSIMLASWALTYFIRGYALRHNLIDSPIARSSHCHPTPRGGGMAIVVSFLAAYLLLWYMKFITDNLFLPVFLSGCLVALVGFIDDHRFVTIKLRLGVHFLSVVGALYLFGTLPLLPWLTGYIEIGMIGYWVLGLGLIWFLNLFNFMDGIDGLAAVEAIFISGSAAVFLGLSGGNTGLVLGMACLALASIGFLMWNWPPAKIFMGDGCSVFIGFVLGIFALITPCTNHINIWTWLILSGYFIVDATVTLLVRFFRREKIYESHRSHAYQILSRRLNSHAKVTIGILFLNIVWLLPFAVLSVIFPLNGFLFLLISLVPLVLLVLKIGAGTTND